MLHGLSHITLSVSDLKRSFEFYSKILGFRPVALWDTGAYLQIPGVWLCLSLDPVTRGSAPSGYSHIAFGIKQEDFSAYAERLARHDVRSWHENRSEGDSVYFLDPDGHKLEVHVGTLETRIQSLHDRPYRGLEFFP